MNKSVFMEKVLAATERIFVIIGVLLFPVFVLPGFSSPYFIPKLVFLCVVLSLALIAKLIKSIIVGEMKFSSGKFDVPVILLAITYLLSAIFRTPNKMEAFFYPGTVSFVILAVIFYFLINQFSKYSKKIVTLSLFGSGILLSISMILTELKLYSVVPQLPEFIKNVEFNAIGSSMGAIVYLFVVLALGIYYVVREKDVVKKIFFAVSSLIIVTGAVLTGIKFLPNGTESLILPSWQTSWGVTIDTLKNSPVLGAGPANYLSAFNLYRPLSYNQTVLWQTRFSSANNFYFTLFTELGLAGIAAIIILLISIYKKLSTDILKKGNWEETTLVLLLVALALIPAVPTLILLLMILLAVFSNSEEKSITVATNKVSSVIVASPVFIGIILVSIFGGRAVAAEMNYKKSLDALTKNDAQGTYSYMTKAVNMNSYVDRYHASLAQIDLALANSLATKEDLTDADRNTISQLVQQAISEGKAAVSLNIGRSSNWEILAQIYRSILAFAQGSDQFAIQTYSQAVALDPINPELRLALGGVYYALGDYDNAITSFQFSIAAKNDFANAHYNLAAAYAAKKDYDKAISEMNTVLSLIDKDLEDYKTAQATLEQYQKEKPVSVATETTTNNNEGNLTQPETVQESNIQPPINLPEEATPPAATIN